jgi:phage/plasmid-like protein (TIGR03299 family)
MTSILNNNAIGSTDIQSALVKANMDWTVSKRPLFTIDGLELSSNFGTFRDDRQGIDGFLGIVGNKYEIMQNEAAFGILDDLIQADTSRDTVYSTVGELGGGRQVFASVDLRKPFDVVPGDQHQNYIVATTSHDGSTATKLFLTTVRVVCKNTLQLGIQQAKGKGELSAIKHTAQASDRLAAARKQLVNSAYTIDVLRGKLQALATRQLTRESISNILDRLFPMPKAKEEGSDAASTRTENKRMQFMELFEANDGRDGFSLVKGTAYNAYNAFTEYTDHFAVAKQTEGKKHMSADEIRSETSFFGQGSALKANALEIVLEATKYAPAQQIAQPVYSSGSSVLDAILNAN